nr:MAG TPA: hypothetical protein [Caudoviricetes sp.]DAP16967.1 MAG TPA: hypothetical protein [Caudoviricetes sp.]DAP43028.1 MAG TPA: hypothetical protein [Caudoviricetes sp.]
MTGCLYILQRQHDCKCHGTSRRTCVKGSKAEPTIRAYQAMTLTGDTLKTDAERL